MSAVITDNTERAGSMKLFKTSLMALAVCVLLGALASCSQNNPQNTDEKTGTDMSDSTVSAEIEVQEEDPTPTSIIKEKFKDSDFGGSDFRILGLDGGVSMYNYISSTFEEIWADEYTGEITNDAIYDRNAKAEEVLNITLVPLWANGTADVSTRITQAVTAGSDDFDVALSSLTDSGSVFQSGYLANYMNFDTIDVTNSWWDKNFVDTFTLFGNRLYWLAGDYELGDDYAVCPIYFNKRILTDAGMDMPYESVREGTWTIDRFYNTLKACEIDLNGDGVLKMADDVVGHIENQDKIKHFVYGCCEKSIEIDSEGGFVINTLSERQINVVERLYQYGYEKGMIYIDSSGTDLNTAFITGHATSYLMNLGSINKFRDMADDFGIVVMPKYDEDQETYGHYISNWFCTVLMSPVTVKDRDYVGTCIETLCGLSTETVNDALYNTLLASKYVRDEESVEMLRICMATKCYDWAVDFSWGGTFASAYNGVYDTGSFNYISAATKSLKVQEKQMEKLLNAVREFED